VLLEQVGREIQVNLRRMEQVLDAFFRDTAKRSEIPTLSKDSHQIRGAFQMLEQHAADQLLRLCEEQIDSYANAETPVSEQDLDILAESLCGLGFFVEALQQQRSDTGRIVAPLLAKRRGEAPPEHDAATETFEEAVEDLRALLPKLVIEIRRAPADPAARAALTAKLKDLVDDAFLRRIPYKILAKNPTLDEYCRIFELNCRKRGLAFDPVMVEYLNRKYYTPRKLQMRACHPRDLVEQVVDMCRYQGRPPALSRDLLDAACRSYFLEETSSQGGEA